MATDASGANHDNSDGTVPLSAFFIAFVSLVSGLMSESAIEAIRGAGSSFLRGYAEADQQRYGRAIAEVMKDQKKTIEQLERFFKVDRDVVKGWIDGRMLVPYAAQQIIAAWLQSDLRDLFSDIKSQRKPTGPAAR